MALNALTFGAIDSSLDQEVAEEGDSSPSSSSSRSVPQSRKKTIKKPKSKPARKSKKSKKEKGASSRRGNGKVMKYTTWRGTPDSCLHECVQYSQV